MMLWGSSQSSDSMTVCPAGTRDLTAVLDVLRRNRAVRASQRLARFEAN
jgi:hypothetical protein